MPLPDESDERSDTTDDNEAIDATRAIASLLLRVGVRTDRSFYRQHPWQPTSCNLWLQYL